MEKWASMIRFIHRKEEERAARGQKVAAHYTEEMKVVERLMLGELAVALEIPFGQMKSYITKKLEPVS